MPRFHFHLRADGRIHPDLEGTELLDIEVVRAHASAVAQELMCNAGARPRHWSMYVEDETGERQFDLFFADADPTLASYPAEWRMLISETCRRLAALTDALSIARETRRQTRILLARSQGRPHLVYARNE